jgi:hypothetical protein
MLKHNLRDWGPWRAATGRSPTAFRIGANVTELLARFQCAKLVTGG